MSRATDPCNQRPASLRTGRTSAAIDQSLDSRLCKRKIREQSQGSSARKHGGGTGAFHCGVEVHPPAPLTRTCHYPILHRDAHPFLHALDACLRAEERTSVRPRYPCMTSYVPPTHLCRPQMPLHGLAHLRCRHRTPHLYSRPLLEIALCLVPAGDGPVRRYVIHLLSGGFTNL